MKRIRIQHNTTYTFSEPVTLLPHSLMIRPRSGHDIRIDRASLVIQPRHRTLWQRDIYGNSVAVVHFEEPADRLDIRSDVIVQHFEEEPLNFLVDDKAVMFPFYSDLDERVEMIPYQMLCFPSDSAVMRDWLVQFWIPGQTIQTYVLLDNINKTIANTIRYGMREEPGVQSPAETLRLGTSSCRDTATLFIEACRFFGLAARFVSGYLHCPQTAIGHGSTHAWAEVYLPGAGWKGFDTTSGIVTGHDHIAVAVTRHPADAPPVAGSYSGPASVTSGMHVEVLVNEVP
ncbi:MAG: transglutaminase family protein [Verrucomicrobiota bacterium]